MVTHSGLQSLGLERRALSVNCPRSLRVTKTSRHVDPGNCTQGDVVETLLLMRYYTTQRILDVLRSDDRAREIAEANALHHNPAGAYFDTEFNIMRLDTDGRIDPWGNTAADPLRL